MDRRKKLIANWKLNADYVSMKKFFDNVSSNEDVDLVVVPSLLGILPAMNLSRNKQINVAAQNCGIVTVGNHTGDTSWIELKDYNIRNIMVGHPEVCKAFGESDILINKKVKTFLENEINVILVLSEDRTDLLKDSTKESLKLKLKKYLSGIDPTLFANHLTIVYKPTFIGEVGVRATPEFVVGAITTIRNFIREEYSLYIGNNIPILFGGEFLSEDFEEIVNSNHVDGVMIDNEKSTSPKYISILMKYLYKASTETYQKFYENNLIIDEPLEIERQRQQINISPFEDYEIDSDIYFKDIDISEEEI
ncbi:triose-phosphate isomerase [Malacoplasma iowae]|uniref:triose-phosphate isomerase n=1 Tax=Malacoplasma iowae TaxID=2116 RepID=UPI002A187652|nr:triose-phosphate isomerase family protein [Malacoplasma iowae]WPL37626.1 triose-phosphate isomerase family protein [Malacoplasma iowae]